MAQSDEVLVKHFYPVASIAVEEVNPKYRNLGIVPGVSSIQPMWVYPPGKPDAGQKGVKLWVRAESFPSSVAHQGGDECESYLDLNEVHDIDSALSYLIDASSPWRSGSKTDHIEVSLSTKDSSGISAFKSDATDAPPQLAIKCQSVTVFVPFEKAVDVQHALQEAIHLLESK